jgi:hypothetical protein
MAKGETVKVFLIDGSPAGLIQCTIANWIGVTYKIPRTELDQCKEREHLKQSGVYFLFGKSEEDEKAVIYIGQAGVRKNGEGILYRLQEHVRNPDKDYWTEAIAFTTLNNSLGPTEICYLEHKFCAIAKEAKRYIVKNGNDPSPGNITEEKESELEKFIDYSKLTMGILGHKVFEPQSAKASTQKKELFYLGHDNERAMGKRTSEGFIVLADSYISGTVSYHLAPSYKNLRKKYEARINRDGKLKETIPFASPSAASAFVLGRNSNGLTEWKTADGKSLKDIENEEAN